MMVEISYLHLLVALLYSAKVHNLTLAVCLPACREWRILSSLMKYHVFHQTHVEFCLRRFFGVGGHIVTSLFSNTWPEDYWVCRTNMEFCRK